MPKGWGGVARKGAASLGRESSAHDQRERWPEPKSGRPAPVDEWVRDEEEETGYESLDRRPPPLRTRPRDDRRSLPDDVAAEIRKAAAAATARHREVLVGRMEDAVAAYDRNRFQEAVRLGKQVDAEAPGVAAVRELVGLAAYRSARWREASKQLEAYRLQSGDIEHDPVLMDCYRAMGRRRKVADLYADLRQQSPGVEILAEARIVAAGTLADDGDLQGAIALLAGGGAGKALRNPADRHLRQWFALADLYERAGDVPKARELYLRVYAVDRDAYGVAERLEALGRERRARPRRRATPPPPATAAGGETAGGETAGGETEGTTAPVGHRGDAAAATGGDPGRAIPDPAAPQ
jgi:tetratricopeptide (TPR) repeat protein